MFLFYFDYDYFVWFLSLFYFLGFNYYNSPIFLLLHSKPKYMRLVDDVNHPRVLILLKAANKAFFLARFLQPKRRKISKKNRQKPKNIIVQYMTPVNNALKILVFVDFLFAFAIFWHKHRECRKFCLFLKMQFY